MRRFFLPIVVLLAVLVIGCAQATPTPTPTATPILPTATPIPPTETSVPPTATATATPTIEPCSAQAAGCFAALDTILLEWRAKYDIALSTPRANLAPPLMELQDILIEAQGVSCPECARDYQRLVMWRMQTSIGALKAFMANTDSERDQECRFQQIEEFVIEAANERRRIETDGEFVPTPTPTRPGIGFGFEQFAAQFEDESAQSYESIAIGCLPTFIGKTEDQVLDLYLVGLYENVEFAHISYNYGGLFTADLEYEPERVAAGFDGLLSLVPGISEDARADVMAWLDASGPRVGTEDEESVEPIEIVLDGLKVRGTVYWNTIHLRIGLPGTIWWE